MSGRIDTRQNPWCARSRSSRCPQLSQIIARQLQGRKKSPDGVPIWASDAAFELLNPVHAQPGPLSQCLLRQPGS
jgi:hypothetical protein